MNKCVLFMYIYKINKCVLFMCIQNEQVCIIYVYTKWTSVYYLCVYKMNKCVLFMCIQNEQVGIIYVYTKWTGVYYLCIYKKLTSVYYLCVYKMNKCVLFMCIQNEQVCIIYVYLYHFHNCSFQLIDILPGAHQGWNKEAKGELTGSYVTYKWQPQPICVGPYTEKRVRGHEKTQLAIFPADCNLFRPNLSEQCVL